MEFSTETQDAVAASEESIVVPDIDTMIQNQIANEMARDSIETATSDTTAGGSFDHSEHIGQCNGSPGASTPPSSPRPSNTRESHQTPASPMVEIPVEMREHNALHSKAISLRPLMPANRYCIGVLNPAKLPKNVRKEEDFLWMKGHGGITVSTVWHQYRQQTGIVDDFDLVIQGFTPKKEVVIRELDFHNDKHVIFRAIRSIEIDD